MAKRRLTIQQQRRIRKNQRRDDIEAHPDGEENDGIVLTRFGKQADVVTGLTASGGTPVRCHIRANVESVVAGDRVRWIAGEPTGVIVAVGPRETLMSRPDSQGQLRPVAANVSQIAVVIAPEPQPHQNLVDRYLVAIEQFSIRPVLIINKWDLFNGQESHLEGLRDLYLGLGYPVHTVSVTAGTHLEQLLAALDGESTVFVGQSGVGKSSLVNLICPAAGAAVGDLSLIAKGRHTTTAATLYSLPSGGNLIDSPGIREFGLWHLDAADIAAGFVEFRPFLGQCKFRNCLHVNEPGCAVFEAVERGDISQRRLASYQQIISDGKEG